MNLALRFSTRCATAYRAAYKEPFDLLFSVPKFEYDDVVGATGLEPVTSAV